MYNLFWTLPGSELESNVTTLMDGGIRTQTQWHSPFIGNNKACSGLITYTYAQISEWKISPHGLPTDHRMISTALKTQAPGNRGPGRWRLNPTLLKVKRIREPCEKALIDLLKDEQGNSHTDPEGLLGVATQFYSDLYSEKPSDKRAREKNLRCLDTRVPQGIAETLSSSITAQEIEGSIDRADLRKSPGEDGLPCEFYKALYRSHPKNSDTALCALMLTLQRLYSRIQEREELPEN